MLKVSLIALFVMTMATFALAASSMPVPPAIEGQAVLVADVALN